MRLAGRFEREATFFSPPVVLKIVPPALEGHSADGPGVLVSGQDTGFSDTQEVYEVALGGGEEEGPKGDGGSLGDLGGGRSLVGEFQGVGRKFDTYPESFISAFEV